MSLTALPNELQLEIIKHLPVIDKYHLSNISRRFRILIGPPNRAEIFRHHQSEERLDVIRLRRTCTRCIRLLPFYHFSAAHGRMATKPNYRVCLHCFARAYDPPKDELWLFGTTVGACQFCTSMVLCAPDGRRFGHGCICGFCNKSCPSGSLCACRILRGYRVHTDPAQWETYRRQIAPDQLEFVVDRLIERLDRCMMREELLRLKLDGRAMTGEYGVLHPICCYIRNMEDMVLRGESVGAKRHRAFWESSKWQQASFDYFLPLMKCRLVLQCRWRCRLRDRWRCGPLIHSGILLEWCKMEFGLFSNGGGRNQSLLLAFLTRCVLLYVLSVLMFRSIF